VGKTVPLKLEDGREIGTAVVHENGAIDATIDTSTPLGKHVSKQLGKGLIEGVSFDPQKDAIFPIIKKETEEAWKNDLLRLMPPKTS
jgi:hypothetical protein